MSLCKLDLTSGFDEDSAFWFIVWSADLDIGPSDLDIDMFCVLWSIDEDANEVSPRRDICMLLDCELFDVAGCVLVRVWCVGAGSWYVLCCIKLHIIGTSDARSLSPGGFIWLWRICWRMSDSAPNRPICTDGIRVSQQAIVRPSISSIWCNIDVQQSRLLKMAWKINLKNATLRPNERLFQLKILDFTTE